MAEYKEDTSIVDEAEHIRRADLEATTNEFIEEARWHKAEWELDMREAYFFAAPHRARNINSRSAVTTKPQDAGESNTSFACEMATDFATVMLNTFMPEADPWAGREPGLNVPDTVKDAIKLKIKTEDAKIFKGISASNFYSECSTCFVPDLALGTVAMWIDDPRPYAGVECQAIPMHELEISTGPSGHIDFRAFVQWPTYRKLQALIPKTELPVDLLAEMKKKPKQKVELRRCFWRDWTVETDIVWQHVIMVGKRLVYQCKLAGAGSCPMIVARFNPMKEWAFGNGPLIQALPDFRHLDELAAAKITNCDMSLRPPVTIPDDSVVNFEEGIEAGMAYPIRNGSEDAVKNIYTATSPDVAIYDRNDVEQRIKRLHFLDYPDQAGKTPPSATQWLDQMTMAQRRIGTPGTPFWREWCAEVFTRYEYLLTKRGYLQKITHEDKDVTLMPINPAHKASQQQAVAQAARVIEIGGQAWPEEWKAATDGTKSIANLIEFGGASDIIVMRPPDQVAAAVKQIAPLLGGQVPGAPPAAANAGQSDTAPPPAGPPSAMPTQVQIRGHM